MTTERPRRGTDVRLRQHQVAVRLSPAEAGAVTAAAERDNISPAAVLRNAFLASTAPQPQSDEVTQRLQHLRAMLADLDSYIQRRAEDLAEPMIRDAEARARLAIGEARGEVQRERDLVQELRRHVRAGDKYRDDVKRYRDRLAAALGRHTSTPWPSLVGEIESRLKESEDA